METFFHQPLFKGVKLPHITCKTICSPLTTWDSEMTLNLPGKLIYMQFALNLLAAYYRHIRGNFGFK